MLGILVNILNCGQNQMRSNPQPKEFIVSMLVSQFRAIKLGLTSALWNMTGSKGSVLFGRWQQRHTRGVGVYDKFTWATHP
jgi:hypothetical protein